MFSAAELAAMRETAGDALPDVAVIKRPTVTVDDTGGHTETLATVATTVCRVKREKPREIVQAGQVTSLAEWIVALPYGTSVQTNDVIETGGLALRVVGLFTGSWRTVERAICTGLV